MKKIKSYIIASILGLLNIVPGNTNAKFVENKNCPKFYKQSEKVFDGIKLFRSFDDNEKDPIVFYKMLRILKHCDKKVKERKSEDCFEFLSKNSKFFDKLKKYDYYSFSLSEIKEKAKNDDFFKYLLNLYDKANSDAEGDKIEGTLLDDNPLDNMGKFINDTTELIKKGPVKSTDIDNSILEFFSSIMDVTNPNHIFFPKLITSNTGKTIDKEINSVINNCFISHGTKCRYFPQTLESRSNLKAMGINFDTYGDNKIDDLTNGFVFFSLIPNGNHDTLKKEIRNRKAHYGISDLKRIPLVSISVDLLDVAENNIYNGSLKDTLADLLEKDFVRLLNGIKRYGNFGEFTRIEVRIPTYIISPKESSNEHSWAALINGHNLISSQIWDESIETRKATKSAIVACYRRDQFKITD